MDKTVVPSSSGPTDERKHRKMTISAAVKRTLEQIERKGLKHTDDKPKNTKKAEPVIIRQNAEGNVTRVVVRAHTNRLINVVYPGIVDNPDKALRTLGGPVRVSEALTHSKKLELRYRPGELFCNPLFGAGRTTCGLLIKVRRRKQKNRTQRSVHVSRERVSGTVTDLENKVDLIDLDGDEETVYNEVERLLNPEPVETITPIPVDSEDISSEFNQAQENNAFFKRLVEEEELIMENVENQYGDCDHASLVEKLKRSSNITPTKSTISIPKEKFHLPETDIQLEALGVVSKVYEFNGLSDFQYLPMIRQEDGEFVSINDDIFPSFGDPDNDILFDAVEMENGDKPSFPFFLPINMSKFDKPMQALFKPQLVSNSQGDEQDAAPVLIEDETEVNSTRARRSVYTHTVDFRRQAEDGNINIIPNQPFPQALEVCASKFLTGKKLETVQELFIRRPIWTKLALEHETKFSAENLKYLLPAIAYFSLNGPWRSLWIRFGYDPRNDKTAFVYQLVDYRFPYEHRSHQGIDQDDPEAYHKFKPDKIPPKCQMFYQFCDLLLPEIQELEGALTVRFNNADSMDCDLKYGYLDEDILEFCRYCMNRCIEVRLHSLGKIKSVLLEPLRLGPGGIVPSAELRVNPRKQQKKRIRITKTKTGKTKNIKLAKPEPFAFTFDESIDVPKIHNLTDYFDDDEDEEEEDNDEEVEENQDPLGDCFDDDEIEDVATLVDTDSNDSAGASDKT